MKTDVLGMGPSINYVRTYGGVCVCVCGGGWVFKPPLHFYCVLHAKKGGGVQIVFVKLRT